MKLSGINLVERHIEKVFILIGVLFAIWLIYQNFVKQSNTVPLSPDQPFVTVQPGEVGQNITKAVADLSEKIKEAQDHPPTFPPVPDYLADLAAQEQNPLALNLVQMPGIVFGPSNAPLQNLPSSPEHATTYVVPVVPPLINVNVTQGRGVAVITPPPGDQSQQQPAAQVVQTLDVVWVQLSAQFQMDKWLSSLQAKDHQFGPNEQALPPSYQRTTFYRVDVQRQELLPNGQWGQWQDVSGTYLNPLPTLDLSTINTSNLSAVLDSLDSQVTNIIDPAFYTIEQASRHTQNSATQPAQQAPPPQPTPMQMPQSGNSRGAGPGGFPPSSPQQPIVPQVAAPQPGPGASPLTGLTAQPEVPVSFYDASVVPGVSYQYRVRIELYNPVYQMPYNLTDPSAKGLQWLASAWSDPSQIVQVSNNLYFYVLSGQVAQGEATIRVFKWIHGTWAVGDEYVHIGEPIGDTQSVTMIDPSTGNLTPQTVDFSTGFNLIDVIGVASNDSVSIVISGSDGRLTSRNSAWDATDPDQQKLITAMQSGASANNGQ